MTQVSLSTPNEKLQDVLQSLRSDNSNLKTFSTPAYGRTFSNTVKETAKSLYSKYLGWESYSNELEFE